MLKTIKRHISVVLVTALFVSLMPIYAASFDDVPAGHWAEKAINDLRNLGITNGVGDNRFGLGSTIKRSEFIAYLVRLMEWEQITPVSGSFVDNSDRSKWFFPYIETALAHDVFTAEAKYIRPDTPITREEMAMMIVGALGYNTLADQLTYLGSPFTDVKNNTGYITIARDFGIINGVGGGLFKPEATAKREEAAAMMVRMYERLHMAAEELHAFYAISSYSQVDKIADLNSVSFGWSRVEYDYNENQVVLNTTSANRNEYSIPSGFTTPLDRAKESGVSTQLMIAVKDDIVPIADSTVGVALAVHIIADKEVRAQLIQDIVTQVNQTVKDGVNVEFDGAVVDIEGLRGAQQALNLNSFLQELKAELIKASKKLYVAVHPKRRSGLTCYDGYDYKAIGEVADKVILMAHDYSAKKLTETEMQNGFTVTPLTPFDEIYYALQAITDEDTGVRDRTKVMLQLSFDSALWMLRDGKIINSTPGRPRYEDILKRIQSGAEMNYSLTYQNPYIRYYDNTDNTDNVVWYEDKRSIQAKITLAKMFGVNSISLWRLGTVPDYMEEILVNDLQ